MSRRTYFRIDENMTPFAHVLMMESTEAAETFVYCPPGLAQGPWTEGFETFDQAFDLAALLAKQINQPSVLITRDKVDWWLQGLSKIGDADDMQAERG